MKIKEIKEFETGEHCFGKILRVNGKDYEDFDKSDILNFINQMFKEDINSEFIIREAFENCLDHLQFYLKEKNDSTCDQCGNWNSYSKYTLYEDI